MAKSCLAFPANFTAAQGPGALGWREDRDGLVKVGVKGQSLGMFHREVTSEQVSKVKCTEHLSP